MSDYTVFKGNDTGKPVAVSVPRPELKGDEVLVRITASGLCYTDMHYRKADMVLGHEGVGVVEEVGPAATLRKGDRVGWGYNSGCCGHCQECYQGHDVFCPGRKLYGYANADKGSFGTHSVRSESFLHPIPDALSDTNAAPLQCAGATVYTALEGVAPGETVAVLGLGGLGHLAVQFAAKLGCRVVVLSGSERKRDEAMRLGAHDYVAMAVPKDKRASPKWPIDRLLVTASAMPDWADVLPMLGPRASIYPLAVSNEGFNISGTALIGGGVTIKGSLVATRAAHRAMLEFAAFHGIAPVVQTFPMTEAGIADAMEKLDKGEVHFRAVLLPESQ